MLPAQKTSVLIRAIRCSPLQLPQHGLSSNQIALITSGCVPFRSFRMNEFETFRWFVVLLSEVTQMRTANMD